MTRKEATPNFLVKKLSKFMELLQSICWPKNKVVNLLRYQTLKIIVGVKVCQSYRLTLRRELEHNDPMHTV